MKTPSRWGPWLFAVAVASCSDSVIVAGSGEGEGEGEVDEGEPEFPHDDWDPLTDTCPNVCKRPRSSDLPCEVPYDEWETASQCMDLCLKRGRAACGELWVALIGCLAAQRDLGAGICNFDIHACSAPSDAYHLCVRTMK